MEQTDDDYDEYDCCVDLWSMGIVILKLFDFNLTNSAELYKAIAKQKL